MRTALAVAALAPLTVASVSEHVWAQATPCPVEETVADCIARLEDRAPQEPVARSAAAVQQRLRARSTGFGLEGLGALGSAISDFLPLFAGMLGGDTENADQTIAADVNLRLDFNPATPGSQVIRGRVIRHAPTVYQSVVNAFPDSVREARVAQLQEALNEFDDVEVRAAFNLETGTFGRTFGQHRRLWGALFTEIIADAEREGEAGPDPAIEAGRFLNDLADGDFVEGCDPDEAGDIQVLTLRCLRRGPRGRLLGMLRVLVLREAELDSLVQAALTGRGFFRFADLVNNQPQLSLEGRARIRDHVAGPNSFGGALRFELGFANVNTFRGYCQREGKAVGAACLTDYLAIPGVVRMLERGDRLWFSVEVERTESYAFQRPADGVAVNEDGPWSVTANVGLGRYLGRTAAAFEIGRIDIQADYSVRVGDAVREDRFTASLTYSQRVSAGTAVVLGLSYANKPEFLGQVDDKLSANFGIRYSLARGVEEQ